MDCCQSKNESQENKKLKGGFKMDRRLIMWVIIGILFLAVLYLTFNAGSSSAGTAGAVIQSASAAKSSGIQSAASYGGMVGGC